MDPRGTVGRIYKADNYTLLHTKYESSGPVWTPGAGMAGLMKRTTIHCYTQNMKALGLVVSEKKIF